MPIKRVFSLLKILAHNALLKSLSLTSPASERKIIVASSGVSQPGSVIKIEMVFEEEWYGAGCNDNENGTKSGTGNEMSTEMKEVERIRTMNTNVSHKLRKFLN